MKAPYLETHTYKTCSYMIKDKDGHAILRIECFDDMGLDSVLEIIKEALRNGGTRIVE